MKVVVLSLVIGVSFAALENKTVTLEVESATAARNKGHLNYKFNPGNKAAESVLQVPVTKWTPFEVQYEVSHDKEHVLSTARHKKFCSRTNSEAASVLKLLAQLLFSTSECPVGPKKRGNLPTKVTGTILTGLDLSKKFYIDFSVTFLESVESYVLDTTKLTVIGKQVTD